MHSGTLLAALVWHHAPSEEARKDVEAEARRVVEGANAPEAIAKEEAAYRAAWAQWAKAKRELAEAHARLAATNSEADRLAVGHALLAFESATMYLRAARTACDCIAEALRSA